MGGINKTNRATEWPGALLMLGLASLVCYEVFMRYILNSPTVFSSEVLRIGQVFLGMLCAGYALIKEAHVHVELLLVRLTRKWQCFVTFATSILASVFCGVMVWLCWLFAQSALLVGERTINILAPLFPVKLMLVIGFGLLGLQFIVRSYSYYHAAKTGADISVVTHG